MSQYFFPPIPPTTQLSRQQAGGIPPGANIGGMPPAMNVSGMLPGMPPGTNAGSIPPGSNAGGMPPSMNSDWTMPGTNAGVVSPSMNASGMPPPMNAGGMPPSMNAHGIPPPMNASNLQSPMNASGMPPPMNAGGMPPSMNTSGMPPPMNAGGMPPSMNASSLQSPMNASGMSPPMNAGGMPPSMNAPGMPPPMNAGGMPPPMNAGGMPPMMNPGGMSPMMNPGGGMPPMMNPGGGMPPMMNPGGGMPPMMNPGGGMPPMMNPGGGMQPGMGFSSPQEQKRGLDLDAMPSVVQVIEDDRSSKGGVFPTGYPTAELPPLVSTEFFAQDHGNSNPKFIRSTVYAIPQRQEMIKNANLPISLSITPIAALSPQEIPPPIVNLGDMGPIRCQRCKAYICPFMEFIDGGRKFRCVFCKHATAVEDNYFAHLDHTGRRTDISYRPELYLGSYEFLATKQYCKNGVHPKEPAFIFFLDVSYNAIRNGLVDLFCQNFIDLLRNLPRDAGMDKSTIRIGLATYDSVIHFYKLGNQGGRPEMLIVNDVEDIFVPLADGFLVDFEGAEAAISSCLREISNNFADTRITETIFGPVIQAGLDALKSVDRVGKLFIFHCSLPTLAAPGQLKNREDRKVLGTDKEKTVLMPASEFYAKLGEDCVKYGCAVDLFFFPNSYLDVASMVPVTHLSGGSIYKYQYFDHSTDGARFLSDLKHDISRDIVFDVMMRVRTSTGIRPTGFYGSFFMQNTMDIEVSAFDSDKSVQVEIKYDDKLDDKELAYFQAAILFTSCSGQRRLRVHNLALPVTTDFNIIYRMADEDATLTHLFKNAERTMREKSPKEMREEVITTCAHILATYREKCSEGAPIGQLILPECLKLLPVHANSIIKCDALNGGSELTVDDRAWMMSMVPSMTVYEVSRFLYPRIFSLMQLLSEENGAGDGAAAPAGNDGKNGVAQNGLATGQQPQSSSFQFPIQVRASMEYLRNDEAYLIDNGMVAFIWIGLNIDAQWVQDVFGVNSFNQIDSEKHVLPDRDNAQSRAVRQLLTKVNDGHPRYLKLYIIKQQDGLESWMKKFLVEDRYAANTHSYVEFLCQLHKEVRNLLS